MQHQTRSDNSTKYRLDSPKKAGAWLYKHGANVLSLDGKNPAPLTWKKNGWQDERQDVEAVKKMPWHRDGVGVISGINGWRCLDVDGIEGEGVKFGAIETILDALGLPHTYSWLVESGSGEGYHIWLLCDEDDAFGGNDEWLPRREGAFDHLEVRWKSHQTAVPPTVHPATGMEYEFYRKHPEGPPVEVTAQEVEQALEAVAKRDRSTSRTSSPSVDASDYDDPEVETIRSALDALPDRIGDGYHEWLDIIMAVRDGAPNDQVAETLLQEWRDEQEAGEYGRKLDSLGEPGGRDRVTVGTLFGTAQEHGWTLSDSERGSSYTVEQFEDDVEALDVDLPASGAQQKSELEYKVNGMAEQAAKLPPSDIEQAGAYLRTQGMRARSVRGWKSAVKKERQRQQEAQEDSSNDAPEDLERGELTAWIAGKILDDNAFALDGSGALYYWEGGRYHKGGQEYLNMRVKEVLDAENMTREFTSYRCREVQHRIETGAPTLWEHPPQDRINVKNGVLNLETMELEDHDSEEWLSTRQLPITYDPEADGSAWENVLSDWMPEDGGAELGFEWIASQIRPAFGRRKATYLKGGKSKGKSTLLRNLVEGVFGAESVEHMTLQELDGDPFAKADLFGAAVNVCADLPASRLEGTSVFKRITGGDRMSAQKKYQDRFNFTPHCHLIFSGNVPIRAPQAGAPFWDRWLVIPFEGDEFDPSSDEHIPQDELDALLQEPEELSALLNELLRVMERVREDGVRVTQTMADALHEIESKPENRGNAATRRTADHRGDSSPDVSEPNVEVSASDTAEPVENRITPRSAGNNGAENSKSPPVNRGEGYAKNFEHSRDSDTQGTCPRSNPAKSFSEGDEVRLPAGGTASVIERRGDKLLVDPDAGSPRKYSPESLSDPDEAPF